MFSASLHINCESGGDVASPAAFERRWQEGGAAFVDFGCRDFAHMRGVQEELLQRRAAGAAEDIFIICEHPPTLSLGLRTRPEDLRQPLEQWRAAGVAVVNAKRGGAATFHNPGQLIIYPVVSLRQRGLGVRRFVSLMLESLADGLRHFGMFAEARLEPAGVWVRDPGGSAADALGRKICSVGLAVQRGVTNHGFAVNVHNDLRPFSMFSACGLPGVAATSLALERGAQCAVRQELIEVFCREIARRWCAKP